MKMKIGCKQCGTYDAHPPCPKCGVPIHIGSDYRCNHERVAAAKGFEPYYDPGLDQTVTGWGDINAACRPQWNNDHLVSIQPRDKSDSYYRELNQKREYRAEMERASKK